MKNNIDIPITFHPDRPGILKFFGKLESEIMEIIWLNGPMTVKRALYFLNKNHNYAYTTVMTVMNRLSEKNILKRNKESHSFLYSPTLNKKEFLSMASEKIIYGLIKDYYDITNKTFFRLRKSYKKKKK